MTVFTLKLIALAAMFIDHTGAVLQPLFNTLIMRGIGRISFPIFAFLIMEGCHQTKNIKKYMARLFLFAVISEIPYDFLFENIHAGNTSPEVFFNLASQNVFFTLFLSVLAVFVYDTMRNWSSKRPGFGWLGLFGVAIIASLGDLLRTDYGTVGVVSIFALYITPKRYMQALVMSAMIVYLYHGKFSSYNMTMMGFGMISVILVMFYNGKRGPGLKWSFYSAYPLHLLVLACIWFWFVTA